MVLKRIEAYGFKSFADKIEFGFENNITAIVGPNGSGKSNVADALRWVLGEQSARNLRGSKMEDVIFNGSAKRKALNIANVSVVLDNSLRTFPIDFNEIAITRRMYRSGESEYYINKAPCRLKDIYELLSGTGIGKDSMSIISQNRADDVLNSKPEDRRLIFEEAAGIGKYKNRKKEAQRKLDDTNANIVRIDDITAELETQIEPLAQAAARTEKFNTLFAQLRELKVDALAIKLRKLNKYAADGQLRELEYSDESLAKDAALLVVETEKANTANNILALEEKIIQTEAKINELNLAYESGNGKIEVEKNRINLARERIQAIALELERVDAFHADAESTRAVLRDERLMLQVDIADSQKLISELAIAAQRATEAAVESERELALIRENAFARVQQTVQIRNNINMTRMETDNYARSCSRLDVEIAQCEAELRNVAAELEKHTQQSNQIALDINKLKVVAEKAANDQSAAKLALESVKVQKSALVDENRKLQIRKDVLHSLQQNYEGFSRATKAILTATGQWRAKIYGAIGELIVAKPEHALAIETALGQASQNLVCDDDATARQAIDYLKKLQVGRATFLPLANLRYSETNFPKDKLYGIIGRASQLVTYAERDNRAVEFLLGRILIADNFANAIKTAKALNFSARIVTLHGELLTPGGAITGGSTQKQSGGIVSRKAEIISLEQKLVETAKQLIDFSEKLNVAERQLSVVDECVRMHSLQLQKMQLQQAEKIISLQHIEETFERLTQSIEADRSERIALMDDRDERLGVCAALTEELHLSEQLESVDQTALNEKISELERLQAALVTAQEVLNNGKIERNSLLAKFDNAETRINDLVQTIQIHNDNKIRLTDEKITLKNTIFRAETEIAALGAQMLDYKQDKNQQNARLAESFENKHQLLQQQELFDKDLRSIRRRISDVQLRLADVRVQNERCRVEIENVCERAAADFHINLQEYIPTRDELSKIDGEIMSELDKQIEALGTINPNAIEEYQKNRDRYEFLVTQRTDLFDAQSKLVIMIAGMDEVMAEQFREAVEQIDKYFSDIFVRLFGGGTASIVFTQPDNMLETGIEVVVQIPGKRRQNMTLLSGGERALTVIALLFAMLQHQPSPFCVLDELDAALDEANVERFSEFIREYRERTQFIIITHRKRTMEVADKLHGITMEETGVSQLVSVKFADEVV
ncbi:MAG: chromosome segregation protein SMC [Negativicutes bacterium]